MKYNWDGYGANVIDIKTIKNSEIFINLLPKIFLNYINEDDVTATPYSTIIFDFYHNDNIISVEIGDYDLGFFSELKDKSNPKAYSLIIKNNELPDELLFTFDKLLTI